MKKLALILLAALLLSGCAARRETVPDNVPPSAPEAPYTAVPDAAAAETVPTVRPVDNGNYEEVLINADNWRQFFEIVELPMTVKNSFGEIDEIK